MASSQRPLNHSPGPTNCPSKARKSSALSVIRHSNIGQRYSPVRASSEWGSPLAPGSLRPPGGPKSRGDWAKALPIGSRLQSSATGRGASPSEAYPHPGVSLFPRALHPSTGHKTRRLLDRLPLDFVIGSLYWLGDWGFATREADSSTSLATRTTSPTSTAARRKRPWRRSRRDSLSGSEPPAWSWRPATSSAL